MGATAGLIVDGATIAVGACALSEGCRSTVGNFFRELGEALGIVKSESATPGGRPIRDHGKGVSGEQYIEGKGHTGQQVDDIIEGAVESYPTKKGDHRHGDGATAYVDGDGNFVVVNDKGQVIQVNDRNNPNQTPPERKPEETDKKPE